jgi:hypothetical protein
MINSAGVPRDIGAGKESHAAAENIRNRFPLKRATSALCIAPCSWTTEESEVESSEHQHNTNIHCQPFPESVSEEREIYSDYDGCHRHYVKQDSYLSVHFRFLS